ncbi:MAG: hypothetical protein AAF943_01490 [Pseudomonadota bacterium]
MIGFIRFFVMLFVVLTLIYVCLSFYSRSVRRGKLNEKWEAGQRRTDRDTFVQRGLERYDGSVRRKLLLGVYVVPIVTIIVIVYLTNFT